MSFARNHLIFVSLCLQFLFAQMAFAQIENYGQVDTGISRSARLTGEDVQWLGDNNFESILNLEAGMFTNKPSYVKEEGKQADSLGLKFFHIPANPMAGPTKEQIDAALSYMTNPNNLPILVHCHHGKDRTGMVIAAYRMKYQGWSYDEAVKEMKSYGFSPFFGSWLPLLKEYEN